MFSNLRRVGISSLKGARVGAVLRMPHQCRPFITVVQQAEVAYREFLGSNRIRLDPGLHWNLPFFHTLNRIDTREIGFSIDELQGYTKDNVPVRITGTLFIKVQDADKATFKVRDIFLSVNAVGESAVRSIIGKLEYDTITSERNQINAELTKTIGDSIEEWGATCTRFEIQNMTPANKTVTEQLEAQMRAERARRENELNTIAKVNTAEGEKTTAVYKSEAIAIAIKNKATAEKFAVEQATAAVISQIAAIRQSLPTLSEERILEFFLETKRLENLKALATAGGGGICVGGAGEEGHGHGHSHGSGLGHGHGGGGGHGAGVSRQVYFMDSKGMMPLQYGKAMADLMQQQA